jgi:hypothetical protein
MHVWYMFVRSRTHISSASFSPSCIKEISHCLRVCKYVIISFRWHKLVPLHLFHVNGGVRTCIHSRSSTDSVTMTRWPWAWLRRATNCDSCTLSGVREFEIFFVLLKSFSHLRWISYPYGKQKGLKLSQWQATLKHMYTCLHMYTYTHTHAHRAKIMSSSYIQEASYDKQLLIHIQRQAVTNR